MSREIKFRVWDKKDKVMFTFDTITSINIYERYVELGEEEVGEYTELLWDKVIDFVDCIFLEYTGLKDKNGVEIYEGDIIFWKDLSDSSDGTLEDAVMVFWDNEHLRWSVETLGNVKAYEKLYDYSDSEEIEVIGNIYENKELIGGNDNE